MTRSKFFWKPVQPRTPWRYHGSVECGEAEQPESEKTGMALILDSVLDLRPWSQAPRLDLRSGKHLGTRLNMFCPLVRESGG